MAQFWTTSSGAMFEKMLFATRLTNRYSFLKCGINLDSEWCNFSGDEVTIFSSRNMLHSFNHHIKQHGICKDWIHSPFRLIILDWWWLESRQHRFPLFYFISCTIFYDKSDLKNKLKDNIRKHNSTKLHFIHQSSHKTWLTYRII